MDSFTLMLGIVVIQFNPIEVDLYLTVQIHTYVRNLIDHISQMLNCRLLLRVSMIYMHTHFGWLA